MTTLEEQKQELSMSDIMNAIRNLFSVDRRILAGKGRIGELNKAISAQEQKIENLRDQSRKFEKAIKDKAFATDKFNMEIRTAEAEVGDQERKLKNIKNQREFRIVSDRIKELKILIDDRESAVISGMEELDRLRDEMNACHSSIGEEELKLTSIKQEAQEEANKIKQRHAELVAEREAAVQNVQSLDPSAYYAYDEALKRTKGDPLSEMTLDGICQACFRRQNSNVMNIVHIGKDIKNCRCQGCGRIMFNKKEEAKGEPA